MKQIFTLVLLSICILYDSSCRHNPLNDDCANAVSISELLALDCANSNNAISGTTLLGYTWIHLPLP